MEEKINIAAILKDKLQGTKLYDLLRNIDVELDKVHTTDVGTYIECTSTNEVGNTLVFDYSKLGTEESWFEGLQILLPSKDMRDWGKFAWKKGDVLVNSRGLKILFDRWANDNYTSFYAKTSNLVEDGFLDTNLHTLASEEEAKSFIKCIEEKLGGKLNRETLEVEKAQPEFKDGDIVHDVHGYNTYIIKEFSNKHIKIYAGLSKQYGAISHKIGISSIFHLRLATEKEKQQLFSALAKEGKAWDSEKKQIVDLETKVDELKPFDKVLVRNDKEDQWSANIFSYQVGDMYYCLGECYWRYCIPYIGNESLLGTTKDVEG